MGLRLLKLLISLFLRCSDAIFAACRRLVGNPPSTRCVVLYYHAIRKEFAAQFAWQMDELFRLTTPVDILDSKPLAQGARYSAVTFDDGFVSVVENALPVLKKREIPCIIFIPTGSFGRRPLWIDVSHPDGAELVLSADTARALAADRLVHFASHSVSHPDFRRLDDQAAKTEFVESKATIESITGRTVDSFSFPHGAHTLRSLELARQCGYSRVFTIEPRQMGDPRAEFVVGRIRAEPYDWPIEFRLKVLGAYRWMTRASNIKRQLWRMMGS